jgi:hypothetical protein
MRKPRQAFGGKTGTGIWWRERTLPDEDDPAAVSDAPTTNRNSNISDIQVEEALATSETGLKGAADSTVAVASSIRPNNGLSGTMIISDDEILVEWDEDLCRPIYRHQKDRNDKIMSSYANNGVRDKEDDHVEARHQHGSTVPHHHNYGTSRSPFFAPEGEGFENHPLALAPPAVFTHNKVKHKRFATKTFANRRQRPLTFIQLMEVESPCSPCSTSDDVEGKAESETPTAKRSRIVPSASVTIPAQREVPQQPTLRLVSVSTEKGPTQTAHPSHTHSAVNSPEDIFEFVSEDGAGQTPSCSVPNPHSSLERARNYFAKLDQTQSLTLDASSSPAVSSRVTRTSRRADLSSPRFKNEYHAYAKESAASGVPPLTIQDYASSRREHFRKKELFDGFLDG